MRGYAHDVNSGPPLLSVMLPSQPVPVHPLEMLVLSTGSRKGDAAASPFSRPRGN
jgi:hypothetical protein